jgi:hypothetical protein
MPLLITGIYLGIAIPVFTLLWAALGPQKMATNKEV